MESVIRVQILDDGKPWIYHFFSQTWVNYLVDCVLYSRSYNQSKRKETLYSNSAKNLTLCHIQLVEEWSGKYTQTTVAGSPLVLQEFSRAELYMKILLFIVFDLKGRISTVSHPGWLPGIIYIYIYIYIYILSLFIYIYIYI